MLQEQLEVPEGQRLAEVSSETMCSVHSKMCTTPEMSLSLAAMVVPLVMEEVAELEEQTLLVVWVLLLEQAELLVSQLPEVLQDKAPV